MPLSRNEVEILARLEGLTYENLLAVAAGGFLVKRVSSKCAFCDRSWTDLPESKIGSFPKFKEKHYEEAHPEHYWSLLLQALEDAPGVDRGDNHGYGVLNFSQRRQIIDKVIAFKEKLKESWNENVG